MKVSCVSLKLAKFNSYFLPYFIDTEDASETDQQKKEDEYIEIREQ